MEPYKPPACFLKLLKEENFSFSCLLDTAADTPHTHSLTGDTVENWIKGGEHAECYLFLERSIVGSMDIILAAEPQPWTCYWCRQLKEHKVMQSTE